MTYDNLARPLCQRALRAWAFGALILLGALTTLGAFAAEASPPDDQTTTEANDDAKPATSAADDSAAPTKPGDDVFKPTEEISEDFAVPFPVDI